MFTSIKAIRGTTASPARLSIVERFLRNNIPGYSENMIFPIYVIAETNGEDDFDWVMRAQKAYIPVPELEERIKGIDVFREANQSLTRSVDMKIIRELDVIFVANFDQVLTEGVAQLDNNAWFAYKKLQIEQDLALPYDQCKYPFARNKVAVEVAEQSDTPPTETAASPVADAAAANDANEAAEAQITQAIDAFTATVTTAEAQMAWLTTHGHSFRNIVAEMVAKGEVTVGDLNNAH